MQNDSFVIRIFYFIAYCILHIAYHFWVVLQNDCSTATSLSDGSLSDGLCWFAITSLSIIQILLLTAYAAAFLHIY